MSSVHVLPAASVTAHDVLKRRSRSWFWEAIIVATVLHVLVLVFRPAISPPDVSWRTAELTIVDLPPEVEIPPPPQAIARPATPVFSANTEVSQEITIAATTFEANVLEALPPPPRTTARQEQDLARAPVFTPYTVAPTLKNREQVAGLLVKEYPHLLRETGIGGESVLWFFIDETGKVVDARVHRSSGHPPLDAAALRVAGAMQFSPAMNRDVRVPVWVQIPIMFTAR